MNRGGQNSNRNSKRDPNQDSNQISICLPKGDVMSPLADYLDAIDFPVKEYHSKNRTYRSPVEGLNVRAKIMAEKDVAIQVAVGNYDLGFCGADWVQEHTVRYRASRLHVFSSMNLHQKRLYACTGADSALNTLDDLLNMDGFVRIVSEYPNIAEHFAISNRLKKFKVFSAWGSVESYPPEHADVVIIAANDKKSLAEKDLKPLSDRDCELASSLCLIVNRTSFTEQDMTPVLNFFQRDNRS